MDVMEARRRAAKNYAEMKIMGYNRTAQSFINTYGTYNPSDWHSQEEANKYYSELANLNQLTQTYRSYINQYGTDEQKAYLGDIDAAIQNYSDVLAGKDERMSLYSNFLNADAWNKHLEQRQADEERRERLINDFDIEAAKKQLEEMKKNEPWGIWDKPTGLNSSDPFLEQIATLEKDIADAEDLQYLDQAGVVTQNEDFEEFSIPVEGGYDDYTYYRVNGMPLPSQAYGVNAIGINWETSNYLRMTDDEIKLYNYIYAKDGKEKAEEYLFHLDKTLSERLSTEVYQYAQQSPVSASIASIPFSLFSGVDAIIETTKGIGTGRIRQNKSANIANAMRSGVSSNMGELGSFLYNTGMSAVDSLLAAALPGGSGMAVLGASAAASAQNDILARGGTAGQALVGGLAAGIAEAFFEKFSIGALKKMKPSQITASWKDFVLNIAKQIGTNASEEAATEVANILSDHAIMGEMSNISLLYDQCIARGMTEGEACEAVAKQLLGQVVEAAASGAVMGGFFAAGGSAIGATQRIAQGKSILGTNKNTRLSDGDKLSYPSADDVSRHSVTLNELIEGAEGLFVGEEYAKERELLKNVKRHKGETNTLQKARIGELETAYFSEAAKKSVSWEKQKKNIRKEALANVSQAVQRAEKEANATLFEDTKADITYTAPLKIVNFGGQEHKNITVEQNGQEVVLNRLSIEDEGLAQAYSFATTTGSVEAANSFLLHYVEAAEGGMTAADFWVNWIGLETQGEIMTGEGAMEKAFEEYGEGLSREAKTAAWIAGRDLREASKRQKLTALNTLKKTWKESGGQVQQGKFDDSQIKEKPKTEEQKAFVEFARLFSDVFGFNVTFFASEKGKRAENGRFDRSTNTIYLDLYAGINNQANHDASRSCLINTLSHESVHNMALNNPEAYFALRDYVMQVLDQQEFDIDARIRKIQEECKENGKNISREDAIEEIVAASCEDMLGSSQAVQKFMEDFFRQNKKAANKFVATVREILKKLRQFFESISKKKSMSQEAMKISEACAEDIATIQTLFEEGLIGAREGNAARNFGGVKEQSEELSAVLNMNRQSEYDYSKSFAEQLEDYKKGKIPLKDTLLIGGTPKVFIDIGFNALPMTINKTHVNYAINGTKDADHLLGEALLSQLPEQLKKPVAIFLSKTQPKTSVVALLNIEVNGNKIVAPVYIDGFGIQNGIRIDSNPVTSVFGKQNAITKLLNEAIKEEEQGTFSILTINQKEAKTLLQRAGLQLPGWLMSHDGFIHSIREKNSPVKPKFENVTNSQQFKRWFGDWQNKPDKASKVVNQDGMPKIVYHGTMADFTIFNGGAFFTDDYMNADGYANGERIIEAYLSIKKPLIIDAQGRKWDQLSTPYGNSTREIIKKANDGTHDGVIFKNINDSFTDDEDFGGTETVYYPFYNTQIKSATDNIGTFDGNNSDILYQNRDFSEQVDAVLNGADTMSTHLKISETPRLLQQAGLPNLPVLMTAKHLKTITAESETGDDHYHGLDVEIVKHLPEYLKNPVLIADSLTRDDSIVVITDAIDSKKRPVIAAIKLNGVGQHNQKYINANILTSAYGKDHIQSFLDRIGEANATIYWNEKKSQEMSVNLGVQFPNVITSLDSNSIIRQAKAFVNTKSGIYKNSLSQSRIETPEPADVLAELFRDKAAYSTYATYKRSLQQYKELSVRMKNQEKRIEEIDAQIDALRSEKKQSGKGTRMDELYRQRKVAQDKINEYRNRMFAMEAKELRHVVEVEMRRIMADTQRSASQKYAQKSRERTERMKMSEKRAKLKKTIRELDRLLNRGTKKKHVKEELRDTVGSALKLANLLFADELTNADIVVADNVQSYTDTEQKQLQEYRRLLAVKENLENELKALQGEKTPIYAGMSDRNRYERLKHRTVPLTAYADESKMQSVKKKYGITEEGIETIRLTDKKKLFDTIGEEFGVFRDDYRNADIELEFIFSKGNLKESVQKQGKQYYKMLKMLTCLDQVIENAVGIEVHNRNQEGYKADSTLQNVYVLCSAFTDGTDIVPVKLEIKEFSDKKNTLYVAIALESIQKDEIVTQEDAKYGVAQQYAPSSDISIAELFSKVNTIDQSFLKYIPAPFLSEEQKIVKRQTLGEEMGDYAVPNQQASTKPSSTLRYTAIDRKIEKIEQVERKMIALDRALKPLFDREKNRYNRVTMDEVLGELETAYGKLEHADNTYIRDAYNEHIAERIQVAKESLQGETIKRMNEAQIQEVYDLYRMVLYTVKNANKLFATGNIKGIAEASQKIVGELLVIDSEKNKETALTGGVKRIAWDNCMPIYAFDIIGSQTLKSLFYKLAEAEGIYGQDVQSAQIFKRNIDQKYETMNWDFEKSYAFHSKTGQEFSVTLDQIMLLYAYEKRGQQATEHLDQGGFCQPKSIKVKESHRVGKLQFNRTYYWNPSNRYVLTSEIRKNMMFVLTAEQKAYVDEMQQYLSEDCANQGNETSIRLYGVKLFKEKNYIPVRVVNRYIRDQENKNPGASPRLINAGFTHNTVPNAKNPIVLEGFTDVWARHCKDMASYHAFTIPLEDMSKVLRYQSRETDARGESHKSVQDTIMGLYGEKATSYIENLIKDLNGGVRVDSTTGFINKAIGLAKIGATALSTSTLVQQPTSMTRAMAYIDPKYFITHAQFGKGHESEWEELKKYAPVALLKEIGGYDMGVGAKTEDWIKSSKYHGLKEKGKALVTDSSYRNEVMFAAPALADRLTWCHIWNAVKKETADITDLKPDTEEFLEACGKRFTEVVMHTQVYDSVLARSPFMRSQDAGAKLVTAFMAEPTVTMNMIAYGVIEGKRGNKKLARRIIGTGIFNIIANAATVALIYAARDDDEDETYPEKYLQSFTTEVLEGINPLTYIPILRDIWSIMIGYDVERLDMSIFTDFWRSFEGLFSSRKTAWEKFSAFIGDLAKLFGLPVKNIIRDGTAIYNLIELFIEFVQNGVATDAEGISDALIESLTDSVPLADRFLK